MNYLRLSGTIIAAICYLVGWFISRDQKNFYENEHNWRMYIDNLSSKTSMMDGFKDFCNAKYGDYNQPDQVYHDHNLPDFGHMRDACWPAAPDELQHPASSITSLLFVVAPLLVIVFMYFGAFKSKFSGVLAACSAFVAGGSFRHHSLGDASGRALDHAGVAFVGLAIAAHLTISALRNDAVQKFFEFLVRVIMLCGVVSTLSTGHIGDNAVICSFVAVVWGAGIGIFWPAVLVNVALPIGVGHVAANKAKEFYFRAECTNDASDGMTYDTLHSMWHICVFVAILETHLCDMTTSIIDENKVSASVFFQQQISPVAACTLVILVFSQYFPRHTDWCGVIFFFVSICSIYLQGFPKNSAPPRKTALQAPTKFKLSL